MGSPTHDDKKIFAAYGQCIFHAGLLWTAILKRRDDFSNAFEQWNIQRVAQYDEIDRERLMQAPGVIHNYQKINAVIMDAQAILQIQSSGSRFASYLWSFTGDIPLNRADSLAKGKIIAEKLSKSLQLHGFKFAGPATAYGLMQDIGMINSHDADCFCSK
jgi:DNA-3-methyladenine glycosylase I